MLEENDLLGPLRSNRFLNLLSEGVSLQLRIDELHARGRIEDWQTVQSYQKRLNEKCATLSRMPEVQFKDYKRLKSNRKARHRYLGAVREWMADMETMKDECLAAYMPPPTSSSPPPQEIRDLAMRIFDLERRFAKYGDMSAVAEARERHVHGKAAPHSRCRESMPSGASEYSDLGGVIRGSPPHQGTSDRSVRYRERCDDHNHDELLESLREVEKGYDGTLQQMKAYEASRIEDVATLNRLDVQSRETIGKVLPTQPSVLSTDRLLNIDTVSLFSKEILAILGSDEVAEMISTEIAKMADFATAVAFLEVVPTMNGDIYGTVSKELGLTLAIVDAINPVGKVRARRPA